MRSDAIRGVQRVFIGAVAVALLVFLMAQVWAAIAEKGPSARLKRLMPSIGAELIESPLTAAQAEHPLELSPGQLADLRGLPRDTLVFLNFWATWCQPCRDELPSMLRLRQTLADRRFAMVAVSYDESWDEIGEFFTRFFGGAPRSDQLLVLRDPAGEGQTLLRERLGTSRLPDTYVIYNGVVLARFVNARNWMDPTIVEYFQKLAPPR